MRIWDVAPSFLCRKHLLAQHGELHSLWSIINNNKKGFSKHPETARWRGNLAALYLRHKKLEKEIIKRKCHHDSPLQKNFAVGGIGQQVLLQTKKEQKEILRDKNCGCFRTD